MKQDILDALCGDEEKYKFIMQPIRKWGVAHLRWEVFVSLKAKGYIQQDIAAHFGIDRTAVTYGLKQALTNKNKYGLYPISATLLQQIYKSIPKDKIGLVIESLKHKNYTFVEIAKYFNMTSHKVRYLMMKEVDKRELAAFQERRKNFVKF